MFSKIVTSLAGQLFIVLLGLAIVSACSMRPEARPAHINGLMNTQWELKKLPGHDSPIEQLPSLAFTEDRISGFNGCNRVFGNYATGQDASIAFAQIGSTRMACIEPAGDIGKKVNQVLSKTQLFAVSRNELNLMDAKRTVLMVLTPVAPG